MRDCKAVLDGLFEFLDKEMDATAATEIKAHLELCRSCFDRTEFEKEIRQHFKDKTEHACPDVVKNRIKKLIENF